MHVDLNWCEFYVHIHDLPLSKMNLGIASFIGNSIGKFRDLEMEDSGRAWGSSLCIRVALNVTQPLIRALRVCTTMGDNLVVSFTYERLQNFCYLCGRLGHIDTYCELRFDEGFQDPGQTMPYGAWLRAPPSSWGTRKLGKLPGSSCASHRNQFEPVRALNLSSCDEQVDSFGSFVPNTVLPAEVEPSFPIARNEGHHPTDETVGLQEVAPPLVPQGTVTPMELEGALIQYLFSSQ
ncbi:UNVERIFIED_CONTAM: hypothetical protein Slati_0982300 [Sesamum latifolium]|uniref:CCHC-type domain-containing protein n=1 Tax=Sesamum latifolium TaxID=2727402 RepID=A0AAW2XW45_9LAMI